MLRRRTQQPSRHERLIRFHAYLEHKRGAPAPIEWVCWTFTQAYHCVPSVALSELNISPQSINADFFARIEDYRGYAEVHAEFTRAMGLDAKDRLHAIGLVKQHPAYGLYAKVCLTKRARRRLAQWKSTNSAPSSRSSTRSGQASGRPEPTSKS